MKAILIPAILFLLPWAAMAVETARESDAQTAEEAPAKDAKSETENLLKPTNELESWVLELNEDGKGEMKVDGDAIVFHTTETTGTDWHIQAYQPGLALEEGKDYIVKFQMMSPDEVRVLLVGQIHEEDWHEIGLHQEIEPTEEFEDYEFEFTADGVVENNNRIGFVLGIDEGAVSVKDMTVTEK